MKKITSLLIVATLTAVITTNVKAQVFAAMAKNAETPKLASTEGNAVGSNAAAKFTKANSRAMENFNSHFKTDAAVSWFATDVHLIATAKSGERNTRAVYDQKGRWQHTIFTYPESQMDKRLRRLISDEAKNYNVHLVQEIREPEVVFYIIHMENDKEVKKLSVYNGWVNVFQQFKKSL